MFDSVLTLSDRLKAAYGMCCNYFISDTGASFHHICCIASNKGTLCARESIVCIICIVCKVCKVCIVYIVYRVYRVYRVYSVYRVYI